MHEFVNLTLEEYNEAIYWGRLKHEVSVENNYEEKRYLKNVDEYYIDTLGAIAEYAVAKYLRVPFIPMGTFKKADLAGVVQVRSIRKVDGEWTTLKVKPRDKDQYVLGIRVADISDTGPYEIMGWSRLKWMREEWYHEDYRPPYDSPYYTVPDKELKSITALKVILRKLKKINI